MSTQPICYFILEGTEIAPAPLIFRHSQSPVYYVYYHNAVFWRNAFEQIESFCIYGHFLSILEGAIYELWEFEETLFIDIELTLGNVQASMFR